MTLHHLLHPSAMVEQSTEGGGTAARGEDSELSLRCFQLEFDSSDSV
jgi:hypothetical protein